MRYRVAYSAEFRQMIVELVRAGRSPAELAKEFEPNAATIYEWLKQAEADTDKRNDPQIHEDGNEPVRPPVEVRKRRPAPEASSKTSDLEPKVQDLLSKKWSNSST